MLSDILKLDLRPDVHRVKLLKQKLARVGHLDSTHRVIDQLARRLLVFIHGLVVGRGWLSWRALVASDSALESMWITKVAATVSAVVLVSNETASAADIDLKGVRRQHQPFHDHTCSTVTDEAITLHLTDTETTIS